MILVQFGCRAKYFLNKIMLYHKVITSDYICSTVSSHLNLPGHLLCNTASQEGIIWLRLDQEERGGIFGRLLGKFVMSL